MSIIALPDNNFRSINWMLVQPTQVNRSEFTSARQVMQLPGAPYWKASAEHVPIRGEANIRAWRAFFARLRGSVNTFELTAVEGPQWGGPDPRASSLSTTSLNNYSNTIVSGTTVTKGAGGAGYNGAAYSSADLGEPFSVSFRASQTNGHFMAGLNDSPGDGADYSRLNFAFYTGTNGQWRISLAGAIDASDQGPYTTATVFTIGYWNSKVYFLVDGVVVRTAPAPTGETYGFDCSIFTVGAAINSIRTGQSAAGGSLVQLDGLPASTTIMPLGSLATVPLIDGDAQLVVLTSPLTSFSTGEADLSFEPALRKPVAWGATVKTVLPVCRMAIDSSEFGYSVDPGAVYGFGFSATEAF